MLKEMIYTLEAPYRENLNIYGYSFGKGEKAACIVGPTRGNEIQQLYICSQLVKVLADLERQGAISSKNQILVIPSVNHFSMNIEERFWGMDHSDINRNFPGNPKGETTERIAAGIFECVRQYSYGIQFASYHTPGDFLPHIRMLETGSQNLNLANLFGLPYVMVKKPEPVDKTTLHYNWQLMGTNAFSVYTSATDTLDEASASQAICSVLRFLTRMGIIKYSCHSGYIASTVDSQLLLSVRANVSGIYRKFRNPGDEVYFGELIAEIVDPFEGEVISQIISPSDGIIFFAHRKPLVSQNAVVYQLLRRIHQ